jgi:hypothetical protein
MRRFVVVALLSVLALSIPGPAHAQGLDPATMALTQADVPEGLRPNTGQTGPQTRDGMRGYQATFEGDASRINPGSGGIVNIVNLVTLPTDPVTGLDEFVQSARQGMPGTATDQPAPPVGDDARAFTTSVGIGPFSISVAMTAFRRNSVVAGVVVMAAGNQAPSDDSLRLAQIVDQRVQQATAGQ